MMMTGLLMELPEGKLPGFYAQVIKGIADCVRLFDRDKELLVLERPEDREAVLKVLAKYKIPSEDMPLILLPEEAKLYRSFTDYGFTTRSGRSFLYAGLIALFRLEAGGPHAEPAQAKLQAEEHLAAEFETVGGLVLAADRQLAELMEGIARAYGCTAKPWEEE